ncbi:DNA-binding PadR family transcriptional regulator [Paenibacillus sp. DS2015]|uniref:PadR family transcriptional regulator n=1 Tax=Paenibacillus sp. DS2015 TaxID=3373917 RepID=UPI003D1EFBAE
MKRNNNTLYAILGILTKGSQSGYDIRKQFNESLRYFWSESYGQIYPMLKEIVRHGYAEPLDANDPRKKIIYQLTAKGQAAFLSWLTEPVSPMNYRDELLLRISFATPHEDQIILSLLEREISELEFSLTSLQSQEHNLREKYQQEHYPTWFLTLRYGVVSTEARIEWCKEALHSLEARKGNLHDPF